MTPLNAPLVDGRAVAGSVDELVADADRREPMHSTDSKSGARFERVEIRGQRCILKHLRLADDWIMRATGDLGCRPVLVWESGILDRLPASIDPAVLGAARDPATGEAAILMRDVSSWLVPEGGGPLTLQAHLRFLDHMAQLHAAFWEFVDTVGLTPLANRYLEFSPHVPVVEAAMGSREPIPPLIADGWRLLPERAPAAAAVVQPLLDDPGPLLQAVTAAPQTFIHGDWKLGNLGSGPDGCTILLDWAVPGAAPACSDLAWYLALNRERLPHAKEAAISAYRYALERHGVDTTGWWERQLALALLGAVVQFGWEKALGDEEELRWWEKRAVAGAAYL